MEILLSHKELDKNDEEIHRSISQDLKDIKTIFIDLYHQKDPLTIHLHSDSIDSHFRYLSKKLPINQRKVLKAYLDCQLEDAYQTIALKDDITTKKDKMNFSFFPTPKLAKIPPNQNKLLELFRNWFIVNMRLTQGLTKRKEIFLKELSESQQMLGLFFERIIQDRQQNQCGKKENQCSKKEKYCEVTLVLILITQFNLCVFLNYRRNYLSIKLLIDKFRVIFEVLKKQNAQREADVHKNLTLVEELHKEQQKQLKQYRINNNIKSLRALSTQRKIHEKQEQREAREQKGEDQILAKYNKVIDSLISKNKKIENEQDKISHFLQNIQERMIGLQNSLLFQTDTEDIQEKLAATKITVRLFENQRLNSAIAEISKDQMTTATKKHIRLCELIFNTKTMSKQDVFLTLSKGKKNLDVNIKDYFNLCMFMKKSGLIKEAIIYFEIMVFHYRKKNIIRSSCIREDYLRDINDNDEFDQEERIYAEYRASLGELEKFVKNQQIFRIFLYSLINLIDLYELSSAHYWALQTLHYVSKIIEFKIIYTLEKINSKLHVSLLMDGEEELSQSDQSLSKQQKECMKLIKKYSLYLEEIKYKIIKCSFNSLTNEIMHNTSYPIKKSQKRITSKVLSTEVSIPAQTEKKTPKTITPVSYNMRRLQEKQNQLKSLIQSRKNSQNNIEMPYYTGMHSPRDQSEFNKLINMEQTQKKINGMQKFLKGASYQIKKKNSIKTDKVPLKTEITKNTILTFSSSKKSSLKEEFKQSVKFNLSSAVESQSQSCANIKTYVSFVMDPSKKKTINFLDTAKTLDESKKSTRIGELRKKLLENREELQDHIKLHLQKLSSSLTNGVNTLSSIDDMQVQAYDFASKTDEILHEFDELLFALKTLRSHTEESFQREMLIDAKIKLLEMIKPKSRHEKLIEVCVGLVNDINMIKNTDKRLKLKKKILWQLSANYQETKETKKAISTFLELARLGDSIGYLKIGEIYMRIKEYGNSIKYHEKYAAQKGFDLSSKVKLAHSYSKVPQYYMKAIDMLSGLLIATGNSSKFKQEIIERRQDDQLIESAVILLSSLHFKNENIEKALELCENYCKINIKNYRVLHILGGYYRFKGNPKKAFECYLSALENNPTHHKSLIELTEFICEGFQYKAHSIQLLRKCFCAESRNFDVLQTLIKFLVEDPNQFEELNKDQLNYETLLKYAEILKNSHNKGFSGQNFYDQASLVYEWALHLIDKSVTIANLDQIEEIYQNLGEICLKKGDYGRSETYYKLYLTEIEKYVNRSKLNQEQREEKILKTKIMIYHFLGKVKKQQGSFKKAINYFNKSQYIQNQNQEKLPNLDSYFHLFEIGYCYFMLQNYETAAKKFSEHREFLLYFIADFDPGFFKEEQRKDYKVESYLEMKEKKIEKKKINYLKQWMNSQNQSSQPQIQAEKKETQEELAEYLLKKNYFENQLYSAFCSDMRRQFIESKEIYKKILEFIKEAQKFSQNRQKMRICGKKDQLKDDNQRIRQNYIRHITANYTALNLEYKGFKKISMLNLANIYRIEGLEVKHQELMSACEQEFPESINAPKAELQPFSSKFVTEKKLLSPCIKQSEPSLISSEDECFKAFKTTLDDLNKPKTKKIHFADLGNDQDEVKDSIDSFMKITSDQGSKKSFGFGSERRI